MSKSIQLSGSLPHAYPQPLPHSQSAEVSAKHMLKIIGVLSHCQIYKLNSLTSCLARACSSPAFSLIQVLMETLELWEHSADGLPATSIPPSTKWLLL